jgi:hypothetical protein
MSTVEEITAAIERLSVDDADRVRAWLAEFAERLWDEQWECLRIAWALQRTRLAAGRCT